MLTHFMKYWLLYFCTDLLTLSIIYVSGNSSGHILYTSFLIVALHMHVLTQSDSTATTHIVIMKTTCQ